MNVNDLRQQSIKLRLSGRSYNEINRSLGVAKSTLSGWLGMIALPRRAQERLRGRVAQGVLNGLVKRNKMQTVLANERARKTKMHAKSEIGRLGARDLQLIGAALYWAEGYKRPRVIFGKERVNHVISLTYSDPEMVKVFIKFLRSVMGIHQNKIHMSLRLYPHIKREEAIRYWMAITGLPLSQINEPSYVVSTSSRGVRPFNRLPFGTVQIRVGDTSRFYRLMGWIDGIRASLASSAG